MIWECECCVCVLSRMSPPSSGTTPCRPSGPQRQVSSADRASASPGLGLNRFSNQRGALAHPYEAFYASCAAAAPKAHVMVTTELPLMPSTACLVFHATFTPSSCGPRRRQRSCILARSAISPRTLTCSCYTRMQGRVWRIRQQANKVRACARMDFLLVMVAAAPLHTAN